MAVWQQIETTPDVANDTPVDAMAQVADANVAVASIAVLPFADLSPAGDQEYFSDGISEEILNVLVGVDGLEVTSRTSSFQFKGRDLGIPAIAKTLNVRHVLEGSVRKSGEAIRVTAQLIDASNDKHLWSDTYDRPLTAENIFAIQDEIANSIVDALSDTLGIRSLESVQVVPVTRDLSAYDLYLQARPMFQERVDLDVVGDLLRQAVEQDPAFAKAWEMRAATRLLAAGYGYSDESKQQSYAGAAEFAKEALSLDPDSSLALTVLTKIRTDANKDLRNKNDLAEAMAAYDRAIELDPRNATALNWRGLTLQLIGELEAALDDFAACMRYEPYYMPCVTNHFFSLTALGKDEESLQAYIGSLNNSTSMVGAANLALLARLDKELAFKSATNDSSLLRGWRRHDELWRAYKNPDQDHSELIESIRIHLDARVNGYEDDFAYIVQPIGGSFRIPQSGLLWDDSLRRYRETDAFKSYMRESGVFEYWQNVDFPPQCRPIGDDDFECD
jgi:TolB-like protein/Flp pilus assembly protein TadD